MFSREEILRKLFGCFEILLFMPRGIERFGPGKSAAVKSFLVPVYLLPFVFVSIIALSDGYSINLLVSIHSVRIIATLILGLLAIYFLALQFRREEFFYKFLNVSNWFNVPLAVFTLPILAAYILGYNMHNLESYAVFITILGFVYTAFIISHAFRLPWELGGFMSIVILAIDQNLFSIALYIRDWASI